MKAQREEGGEVRLEIGGTSYRLVVDMHAMRACEQHFSTPERRVRWGEFVKELALDSIEHVQVFYWSAFLKHQPTITLDEVNDLVQRAGGVYALSTVLEALQQATTPDPADVKDLGLEGATDRPRKARARGTGAGSISKRVASA